MSSTHFEDTVTQVPAPWANDVNTLVYEVLGAAQTLSEVRNRLGLKSLAYQNADQVAITGGLIDGVSIGTNQPVQQVIATRMSVVEAPISDQDVVNRVFLRQYVQQALAGNVQEFNSGLGTMAAQNANNVRVSGGILDNVDIGTLGRASGAFTALKASNIPTDGDDVVTLGWLVNHYDVRLNAIKSMAFQDKNAVEIVGGTIDSVNIGLTGPVRARLRSGSIVAAPTTNEDIANKRYVDSSIVAFRNTLGSMAFQSSHQVNITGGSIEGTTIGLATPSSGRFTQLQVESNSALVRLKTTNVSAENQSGIVWQDQADVASFIYHGAQASVGANTLELSSSIPINIHTAGASVNLTPSNVLVKGTLIGLGAAANNQVVIGVGGPVAGYRLTARDKSHLDFAQIKRGLVLEGVSELADRSYASTASGVCTINVNAKPFYEVNVTHDIAFALTAQDNTWPANAWRSIKLLLKFSAGGKNVVFGPNVQWGSQIAPDYTATNEGDFDIVTLGSVDGETWYAQSAYAENPYARLPSVAFMAGTSGNTTRLTWNVQNALSVTLSGTSGLVQAVGNVVIATPSVPTTYTLTATGNDGRTVVSTVTVNPAP